MKTQHISRSRSDKFRDIRLIAKILCYSIVPYIRIKQFKFNKNFKHYHVTPRIKHADSAVGVRESHFLFCSDCLHRGLTGWVR